MTVVTPDQARGYYHAAANCYRQALGASWAVTTWRRGLTEVVHGDAETRQAVEDWHYWVERGYGF
jgi:hypothetical protein